MDLRCRHLPAQTHSTCGLTGEALRPHEVQARGGSGGQQGATGQLAAPSRSLLQASSGTHDVMGEEPVLAGGLTTTETAVLSSTSVLAKMVGAPGTLPLLAPAVGTPL